MEWKKINDKYKLSEFGDIYCYNGVENHSVRLVKPYMVKMRLQEGYLICNLYNNKILKKLLIHRLVYSNFIGEIPENCDVHHKDEDKLNNHYSNLEIINHSLHTKLHWELGKKIPKRVPEKIKVVKDRTKNKTVDIKLYQKNYREMRKNQVITGSKSNK